MRKISANHILPVSSPPLKNGIIILDEEGSILEIRDTGGNLREESGLEFYNGVITPGFVIPWLRFDDTESPETALEEMDRDLLLNGIKGVGLVLRESMLSDGGFELMRDSSLIYHPVIELCPESGENEFEVFNRGIDLCSRAWNEFRLPCSLTACSHAMQNTDIGKYLDEYSSSHQNVTPSSKKYHPVKSLAELLPPHTLQAAAEIFEDDVLGSIEPGKKPGLILVSGLDPQTFVPGEKTAVKVLV
ncbi:hypothetical protein ACFLR8_01150 [Bacteroidota bacterium]